MLTALVLGIGAGGVFAAVSVAVLRLRLVSAPPLRVLGGIGLLCVPVVWAAYPYVKALGWDALAAPENALALGAGLIALALGAGYLQFYALVQDSISLRMLHQILEAPSETISSDELQREYPFRDLLDRRIAQAVSDGLFVEERAPNGERWLVETRQSRILGITFGSAQSFFGWGDGARDRR